MSYMDEMGFSNRIEPNKEVIFPKIKEKAPNQHEEADQEVTVENNSQTQTFEKSDYLSKITDKFFVMQDFQEESTLLDKEEEKLIKEEEKLKKEAENTIKKEEKETKKTTEETMEKEVQNESSRLEEIISKVTEERESVSQEKEMIIQKVSHLIEINTEAEAPEIKEEFKEVQNQIKENPQKSVEMQVTNLDSSLILALMSVTTGFN